MRAPAVRRGRTLSLPSRRALHVRFQSILGRLRGGKRVTATSLARAFEMTERTMYRDLATLRDGMNVPLDYDAAERTWRLTSPTMTLPGLPFSAAEMVAVYFAEKVLAPFRGTPFDRDLLFALTKLRDALPEEVTVLPRDVLADLSFDLGPLPESDPAVFGQVIDAMAARQRIVVRYKSLNSARTTDRTIEPYHLFGMRGDWYVAAFDHVRREIRIFAVHRIGRVTLTKETFQRDPGFDLRKYMADSLGGVEKSGRVANVAIRFAERQARWIRERPWHRTARVQDDVDGGCVLRMRVALTSDLRRWVMQFGSEAEVLAPKSFRSAIAREMKGAGALYTRPRGRT